MGIGNQRPSSAKKQRLRHCFKNWHRGARSWAAAEETTQEQRRQKYDDPWAGFVWLPENWSNQFHQFWLSRRKQPNNFNWLGISKLHGHQAGKLPRKHLQSEIIWDDSSWAIDPAKFLLLPEPDGNSDACEAVAETSLLLQSFSWIRRCQHDLNTCLRQRLHGHLALRKSCWLLPGTISNHLQEQNPKEE